MWILSLLLTVSTPQQSSDPFRFLDDGRPQYARTAFRRRLRREPRNYDWNLGLGLAEVALGNPREAIGPLTKAISIDAKDARARLGLARATLAIGRSRRASGIEDEETELMFQDAMLQAERAAKLDPAQLDHWHLLTDAALEAFDFDRAGEALEEAKSRGLDEADARRFEGHWCYSRVVAANAEPDDPLTQESLSRLRELVAAVPDSAALQRRLGDLCHFCGHWQEALDAWHKSIELDPFQNPCLELVLAYLPFEQWRPAAVKILDTARAQADERTSANDPRRAFPLFCRAQAHLLTRDYSAAEECLSQARKLEPALELDCLIGIGEASYRLGRHDEAYDALLRSVRENASRTRKLLSRLGKGPSLANVFFFLGNKAVENEDGEAACDLLAVAAELAPDDAVTMNNYAFVCREAGRIEESAEAYLRLVELVPGDPRYLNDAAVLLHYYLKRDFDKAADLYQRAIDEATAQVDNPRLPNQTRDAARKALRDAKVNLKKLEKRQN